MISVIKCCFVYLKTVYRPITLWCHNLDITSLRLGFPNTIRSYQKSLRQHKSFLSRCNSTNSCSTVVNYITRNNKKLILLLSLCQLSVCLLTLGPAIAQLIYSHHRKRGKEHRLCFFRKSHCIRMDFSGLLCEVAQCWDCPFATHTARLNCFDGFHGRHQVFWSDLQLVPTFF